MIIDLSDDRRGNKPPPGGDRRPPVTDPHESHGSETLSLTSDTEDGGLRHQSWRICECTARVLRRNLGPPQGDSTATAEAVRATAEAVLRQPGNVQL